MTRAVLTIAAALLLAAAAGMPVADRAPIAAHFEMHPVTRVAGFQDVAHTFVTQYKFSAACPERIVISAIEVDKQRNIGSVPLNKIVEDNVTCSGEGTTKMSLVSEATVKQPGLLARLGFPLAAAGLQKNPAALATVQNMKQDSSLLVGFDEGTRKCGASTYSDSTFFFFIREPAMFKITITTGVGARTSIAIPPNTRSLFITGPGNKLCLLSDTTTGAGRKVVVTSTAPGVSEAPLPSASPSPAPQSVAPSATPSPSVPPTNATAGGDGTVLPVAVDSPAPSPQNTTTNTTAGPNTPAGGDGTGTGATTPITPNATDGGGSVCFPGCATVQLESGTVVPMTELRIGDRVRTGATSFSDVFLFTHRDANVHAQFVRLVTASGRAVTLTKSHYIYANDALVSAGEVRIGDSLQLEDGEVSVVSAIENMSANGLYNPQTIDGKLVVDGIVTSAYTTAVHPRFAHSALLAPLRFLYGRSAAPTAALDALTRFISAGANTLARLVPSGPASFA